LGGILDGGEEMFAPAGKCPVAVADGFVDALVASHPGTEHFDTGFRHYKE
jgi:hypothetical protein